MKAIVRLYAISLNLFLFKVDKLLVNWSNQYKSKIINFLIGHLIYIRWKFNIKYTLS